VSGSTGGAHAQYPSAGTSLGDQVDRIFAPWDKPDSPGCAVAVINARIIIYERGYGMADLEHNIPITPTTVFHAASLAKQFTAMSIMLLVEQGRLSLDDDVRTYIPELSPSLARRITIADMLHHVSGIRDQWDLVTMAGWRMSDDVITQDDVLDLVKRMKELNFEPNEQFLYSNTNYTLAGLIVERVARKKSLSYFARDNIFLPLGMRDTRFSKTHGLIVQNRAYGYRMGTDQTFEVRMPNYDLTGPTNLLTTVEDLARWDRNFDDKTVGGDVALSQMQTPRTLSDGTKSPYGLGLYISTYRGFKTVEHDGRDAGYRSYFVRFPDRQLAVACLCNLAFADDNLLRALVHRVADVYLPPRESPIQDVAVAAVVDAKPSAPVPAGDLAEYKGLYYSDEIDTAYNIIERDGSLVITRRKYEDITLVPEPAHPGFFQMWDFSNVLTFSRVRFTRDAQLRINGFLIDGDRIRNFQFTKQQ
jgi:CubicO group peptidase (beta-lactamase class C family)